MKGVFSMYDELKKLVDDSNNIVFLAVQAFPQRVEYLISEALTACIIKNMTIRLKRF